MTFSNRISSSLAAIAVALLLCGGTAALAQAQPPSQPSQTGMNSPISPNTNNMNTTPNGINAVPAGATSPQDRVFLKDALEGGMAEVQLGHLALQKSSNADVKQFAQRMVDDHTKMGDQLKPIAQQVGVKIPDGPSKKDKTTIAKLQGLNGGDFDKAYMKDMVKDHKTDLSDFRSEADQGSNLAVKNAASQGAGIINQHLQMAEQIDQKTNAMASNGDTH
jgi:putative membrane protein